MNALLQAVTTALNQILEWFGTVIGSLLGTGSNTALQPLLVPFAITVAISVLLLSVRIIRKVCWGA